MKIHRLEIQGFGPFRDRQVVDFDAFAADGIFLIGGRTGAGKSSILDAICFALYGGVPRYDDGEKRFRSDHSDIDEPTSVALEFSAAGERWRVERVPQYERRKRAGHGTTLSPAQARLFHLVDGEWVGQAARPVDVAHELEPVLGLTQAQFLQVILLAQGRFARFLLARNDERQALLRTLFDSRRFGDYEIALEQRRRDAQMRLDAEGSALRVRLDEAERLAAELMTDDGVADELAPGADEVAMRLAAAERARLRAVREAQVAVAEEETAAAVQSQADAAHARAAAEREQQERRDRARLRLDDLRAQEDAIAALRDELQAATAAEVLRGVADAVERATAAAGAARVVLARVEGEWGRAAASIADVDAELALLQAERGSIAGGLEAERALPALLAERDALADTLTRLEARRDEIAARRTALPAVLRALRERRAAAGSGAALLSSAELRTVEAKTRLAAARDEERQAVAVAEAERAAAVAGRLLTRASAVLDDLRERRFRDRAGELAERLVDGEPCAVCGSLEHPAPAPHRDEPVTADDLADAEEAKESALAQDRAATQALQSVRESRADAAARAVGLDVAAAQARLDEASDALATARAAVTELDRLDAELREHEAEQARLDAELAELAERREDAATERARLAERCDAMRAQAEAARGEDASVEERLTRLEGAVDRAKAYADALRECATRDAALADATAAFEARRIGTTFADLTAVRAAMRTDEERERLDGAVRQHTVEVEKTKSTLLELELAALPEEPVPVAELAEARDAARATWTRAVSRSARARDLADQLGAASDRAHAAHRELADLADQVSAIQRLADTVAGRAPNTMRMNLETFVLAAELEEIVAAANLRLDDMSQGRYLLRHTDARAVRGAASGLGIEVLDRHTGMPRPVQSLSGGETFLASLALALGLAEVVTARAGGITLDTLFIDEGFGSLDADTLEVAMRTLDELRQGGRTVGVISHVEAMKDAIPAHVLVEATPQGPSVIRQDAVVR